MEKLICYTRKPINNVLYDEKLAYSMHLALCDENGKVTVLNHNSGVLFAKGIENEDGSITPKSLKKPYIFSMPDDSYRVVAVRTEGEGEEDASSKGSVIMFSTSDFAHFEETGLVKLDDEFIENIRCTYDEEKKGFYFIWENIRKECKYVFADDIQTDLNHIAEAAGEVQTKEFEKQIEEDIQAVEKMADGCIEGLVPVHAADINDNLAAVIRRKLLTPVNIKNTVPEEIVVSSKNELEKVKADAFYSDGTVVKKGVDWDCSGIDFTKEGTYKIHGKIKKKHFAFPVAFNRADPCVCRWDGRYYFIATNDADGNHTLYIREADTLEGLVNAKEVLLLDSETYEGIGGLLWAPEFHEIEGRLYIFHAATPGEFFREESHIMELRKGGNPACREDWSAPRRIVRMDGSDLCEAGKTISLDMTCFQVKENYYAVWSQREFLPKDLGAWLYIAKLNKDEPWKLASEPVVLSKPDYGWANNHTFVDEGPFALIRGEKIYLTYSSAAVDTSYVVSFLETEVDKELLNRSSWRKNNYPVLTSRSVEGEYGTGHNAYVTDEDGVVWNTYHARPGTDGVRSSGIRRVHFDADGCPRLDVTEELDVADGLGEVSTMLRVCK